MQHDKSPLDIFKLFFERLPSDDVLDTRMKSINARENNAINAEVKKIATDLWTMLPPLRRMIISKWTRGLRK